MEAAESKRFDRRTLVKLIVPLVVEQLLAVSVGMFDTLMVSGLGEYAVSAISLVDQINVMLINLFTALATGGAVCASQYLGRRDTEHANDVARQLVYATVGTSLIIALIVFALNRQVLALIYGTVEKDVMDNAIVYFYLAAASYPFLGLYNASAALFRSMGNSKISMRTSIIMNLINLCGNALLIYVFHWGVFGAALATLVARAVAAFMLTRDLCRSHDVIRLNKVFPVRVDGGMLKRILGIGLPNGMENSVFQLGKILVAKIVSLMGTSAIAANAIVGSINSFSCVPGNAISLGMITVVGQCVGAGDIKETRRQVRNLVCAAEALVMTLNIIMLFLRRPLLSVFSLQGESLAMGMRIMLSMCLLQAGIWTFAFPFPCALRAAGDARFTMNVSIISMFFCRVGLCYAFYYVPALQKLFVYPLEGVYWAMYIDWVVRVSCFMIRWFSGKWIGKKVI